LHEPKDEIQIELSKSKIAVLTFAVFDIFSGAIAILILSYWQTSIASWLTKISSIASIIFFGICGVYGLIKIFDSKLFIFLNRTGMIENSGMMGVHLLK
jgi:uncharacterized membrane protein YdbT with pleckstrin-like domain